MVDDQNSGTNAGRRRSLVGAAVLAVLVLVVSALTLVPELHDLLPKSTDQEAVAAAVQRVIVANQTVGIPLERDVSGGISPATMASMHLEVAAAAATLLAPSYRDQWMRRMDAYVDGEMTNEFIFGGGADGFERWQIAIDGDHASVKVRCRIYLDMAQTFAGARTRAENTVDDELTLVRVGGDWLVSSQSHRFAPGGEP